jgi:hypothetical protein
VSNGIGQPHIDPSDTPFEQTRAFRQYGAEVMPEPEAAEEPYTKALIREQGFDGLPHTVASAELNRYVQAGEREIFRGVSNAVYADAFRTGDFFVGRGSYGSGMYAVGGTQALAIARGHAGHGVILRMVIKRGARIGDYDELQEAAYRAREDAIARIRTAGGPTVQAAVDRGDEVEAKRLATMYDTLAEAEHAKYDDIGRFAAYHGFDAVHVADRDYYVILNRTAVRVQRVNLR